MHPKALAAARRQHGLVTRQQLLGVGVPRSSIADAVGSSLQPVHRGVYRLAGSPLTWEQSVLAACLAANGVASHRTAAQLWGLLTGDDAIEVVVPRARDPRLRGVVVYRIDYPFHSSTRRGIPVINPLETLVLLGASASQEVVAEAMRLAVMKRLVTADGLRTTLEALERPGRRGPAVLKAILDEWERWRRPPDSVLETKMQRLLLKRRLPLPRFQHEVRVSGVTYRIDFAYPEHMIAIEVEGSERHTLPRDRQRDADRRNELTSVGWKVIVFTWHDVVSREDYVDRVIRRELAAAGLVA